jgi:DNA topoisomerase IB
MSGLAATGADEAFRAEQRDSAAWREPRSALSEIALRHHADVLARIRLTRTAAERGPVLSGECGQVACGCITSVY